MFNHVLDTSQKLHLFRAKALIFQMLIMQDILCVGTAGGMTQNATIVNDFLKKFHDVKVNIYYTPAQRSWRGGGGYTGFTLSVLPSIRLSVRLSEDDMVSGA